MKKTLTVLAFAATLPTLAHADFAGYKLCPATADSHNPPKASEQFPCGLPGQMSKTEEQSDFVGYYHHSKSHDVWLSSTMLNHDDGKLRLVLQSAQDDSLKLEYFDCQEGAVHPTSRQASIDLKAGELKEFTLNSSCTKQAAEQMWKKLDEPARQGWINYTRSVNFVFMGSVINSTDFTGHNITISEKK